MTTVNVNAEWAHIHPRDAIEVWQPTFLSAFDLQLVAQLYQPFIGTVATSLYHYLVYEIAPKTFHSDTFQLDRLLASLNIGIPAFYNARMRLEAIGLIKTFEKKDATSTNHRIEVYAPVQPKDFFKDALLSTLLINQIGHRYYKELRDRFVVIPRDPEWQEVSASFNEVFATPSNVTNFDYRAAQNHSLLLKELSDAPVLEHETIDWDVLQQLLKSQFIKPDALNERVKKMIVTLHAYYHLSEQEIVSYILYATDMNTKLIDEDVLFNVVLESYEQLQKHKTTKESTTAPLEHDKNTVKTSKENEQAPAASFDEQVERLITLAESMKPFDFIHAIKTQRNGFVSKDEQKIILNLLEVSKLSPAVINILIHYLLVVQNNTSLWKESVDRIANDWAQKGVRNAREAVETAQQFNTMKQTKKTESSNRKTTQTNRSTYRPRVEKLPKWTQETPVKEEKPLEGERLRKLQDRIAKLKTSQNQAQRGEK